MLKEGMLRNRLTRWTRRASLGATILAAGIAGASGARSPEAARSPAAAPAQHARPNLIVIMGDDIGYSDIHALGGEVDTPNLDELARHSIRFANFFNMSRCCPSRASLITGRYPHRVNMAGNGTSLSKDVPTVAEELRDGGYATTMVGKWHLTEAVPLPDKAEQLKWLDHQAYLDRDFGDRSTYPAARGFQKAWGIIWGVTDYYDPFSLVDQFEPVKSVPKDFYLTNAISDHAVSEVTRLGHADKPFFMYLAYTAAHWPLMAPANVIDKYVPRFQGGWDAMRKARYDRQVKMGLVDPKTEPLPALTQGGPGYEHDWNKLTPRQKAIQVRKMATHAAMIDIMDQGIGRVIQALKASGQYDNTVIMFLIDNGASPEMPGKPGYDRQSATRSGVPFSMGRYPTNPIGTETAYTGIGAEWASAANTPWRYWKKESYQGGIHTPFFISWPGHMGGREGSAVTQNAHIIDITPTLLDLAHVTARPSRAPIDGISLAGALSGKPIPTNRQLYFEHYGARAVIDGQWKAVSLAPGGKQPDLPWSLYDLSADRTEMKDVAATHRDVLTRLGNEWSAWAKAVGVPPRGPGRIPEGDDS